MIAGLNVLTKTEEKKLINDTATSIDGYFKDLTIENEKLKAENKTLRESFTMMEKAYDNLNNRWDVIITDLRTLIHSI